MPFDMGFDFRSTEGFVTDPAYADYVAGADRYPTTYTNANGDSINGGWVTDGPGGTQNDDATNDPRIAGGQYQYGTVGPRTFRLDLSSGSNPGVGDYNVDIALGSADSFIGGLGGMTALVKDDTTTLIDLTNGGSGYNRGQDHYTDAVLNDVAATTTWTGTPVMKTFATTTCNVTIATASLDAFSALAHFRLTLAAAPAAGFGRLLAPERNQLVRAA